ncbi:MAG: DUF177 domain-containing protein [Thermodesulfovibrionia bacterium]|nr:DUF177 domain-containing protein [Thermodesulfovibrionia bacterium]MCK5512196.1 DUF177 domain-containing protein [Thermodesulfovibrionia bacterium]
MHLIVSEIPEDGIERELKIPLSLEGIVLKEEVQVFLKILRFGTKVHIDGRAKSGASVVCSRCLKEFSYPIETNFSVEYLPKKETMQHREHELMPHDLNVSFYEDDAIDIKGLVGEQVLLTVPMKPLCKTDCLGICPQCGKDLNTGSCTCSRNQIDPRLAKLKTLKESIKKGN